MVIASGSLLNFSTFLCTNVNSALTTTCVGVLKSAFVTVAGKINVYIKVCLQSVTGTFRFCHEKATVTLLFGRSRIRAGQVHTWRTIVSLPCLFRRVLRWYYFAHRSTEFLLKIIDAHPIVCQV